MESQCNKPDSVAANKCEAAMKNSQHVLVQNTTYEHALCVVFPHFRQNTGAFFTLADSMYT